MYLWRAATIKYRPPQMDLIKKYIYVFIFWADDRKVASSNPAWNTTTSVPLSKALSPQLCFLFYLCGAPTNRIKFCGKHWTGLWFQTEGEKRCCSTGGMRNIKSFLNIKACKHVTVETQYVNINLKMSIKCPL